MTEKTGWVPQHDFLVFRAIFCIVDLSRQASQHGKGCGNTFFVQRAQGGYLCTFRNLPLPRSVISIYNTAYKESYEGGFEYGILPLRVVQDTNYLGNSIRYFGLTVFAGCVGSLSFRRLNKLADRKA